MDVKEIGLKGVDWICVVQDRYHLQAHVNCESSGNFLTSCVTISFSERLVCGVKKSYWVDTAPV